MTSRTFTAGWLVAAALASSWAVSSASDAARAPQIEPPAAPQGLPPLSADLEAEIARLSARMSQPAKDAPPRGRDPFSFGGGRRASIAAREPEPPVMARAPMRVEASPVPALPSLSALVELTAGAVTAVISFQGELHYAVEGGIIASRYRVDVIRARGVDVVDLSTGTVLHLTLQQ